MGGRKVHYLTNQTFFCYSLVKSEPTWMCFEEFKFEAIKNISHIIIDSTSLE